MRKRVSKSSKVVNKIPTPLSQVTTSASEIIPNVSGTVASKLNELTPQLKKVATPANKITFLNIIQAAKNKNQAAFNKVPDKKAAIMTSAVLSSFKQQLKDTHEGSIKLMGLGGRFIVKEIQKEQNGEKIIRHRIVFRGIKLKKKEAMAVNANEKIAIATETEVTGIANVKLENAAQAEVITTATGQMLNTAEQAIETTKLVNQDQGKVNKIKKEVKKVNVASLVKSAKAEKAGAFDNINEKRAVAVVRAVLAQASKQISETEDGSVVLAGLGRFVIRQVQVEKEGQKVTRRRIAFRPLVAKKKKAE
jgi:hypothetical protein